MAITLVTFELYVSHHLVTMDNPILLPNLIMQVLRWRVLVDTMHLFDDQLCKFMVRVNYFGIPCSVR